jgi:hypothetical protein
VYKKPYNKNPEIYYLFKTTSSYIIVGKFRRSRYEREYTRSDDTAECFDTSVNQKSRGFDAFSPLFAGVDPGGTAGDAQNEGTG